MYQDLYDICLNVEEVMQMFSKELQELDHNTVIYMIDELQDQLDEANATISEKDAAISMKDATIADLQLKIKELESRLSK